jgi:hypothetical protein
MFSVRIETFGMVANKGVDADYLVLVLKSMTNDHMTMGKPRSFPVYGSLGTPRREGLTGAVHDISED